MVAWTTNWSRMSLIDYIVASQKFSVIREKIQPGGIRPAWQIGLK